MLLAALLAQGAAQAVDSGCAELADPRDAGLPTLPAGVPQVTCAGFFPFAVVMDGSESTRLEVRVVGGDVTSVALGNSFAVVGVAVDGVPFPQRDGFVTLFDDGSHGDRVAGDGIWTRDGFTVNAIPVPPIRFANFDLFRYENAAGGGTIRIEPTIEAGQFGPARMGQLQPAFRANPALLEPGLLATPNALLIVDPDLHAELRWLLRAAPPGAAIQDVTRRAYEVLPDRFDFLLLMPGAHVPGGLRGAYLTASNDVSGIGRPLVDLTADWGSAGRLQGVLPLNLAESGPVLHEIAHRWGIFVGQELGLSQCAPVHAGVAGVGFGALGGFDASTLEDNGDGTWSADVRRFATGGSPADTASYSPLELYLAGLIPPSEVPPFPVPVNADCGSIRQNFATGKTSFAADAMVTRTIDELIAGAGPRVPDHTASQRDFALAWVAVLNRMPTASEAGWFQHRAEYIGRNEPGSQPFRLTFWEATGGRASLDTDLSFLIAPGAGRVFGDGFEP